MSGSSYLFLHDQIYVQWVLQLSHHLDQCPNDSPINFEVHSSLSECPIELWALIHPNVVTTELNVSSQYKISVLHQHQPQNQQQLHWHNHHKCLHLKNQQQQQKITDQCTELQSLGSVLTGKKINNFDMTQTVTLQQCNIYCSENSHLSLSISKKTCFVLHSIVSFSDLWLFVLFVYFIVCLIVISTTTIWCHHDALWWTATIVEMSEKKFPSFPSANTKPTFLKLSTLLES